MAPSVPPSLTVVADVGGEQFHVGDEAMLVANLSALRHRAPAVEITVVGRHGGATESALSEASGLFLSGGGNLCSTWPELLRQRIFLMRAAWRRGVPVAAGGQTIGPDLGPGERDALAAALAGVAHFGVRDLPSAALALEMGVPPDRLHYQPDDAFLLPGRPPTGEATAQLRGEPFVAVTLDPAFAAPESRGRLVGLAGQLARIAEESACRLAFLPHVGRLGDPESGDGAAGAALRMALEGAGAGCALLPVLEPEAAVWVTQRASLVVSSRYHPLVFGTAAAVPCLGIYRDAYTRTKLEGALAHVGMAAWCLPEAAAEEGGVLAAFRRLWRDRDAAGAAMKRARAELEVQEDRRWRGLLARLGLLPEPEAVAEERFLGCSADRLAAAALAGLARERRAHDEEGGRWRAAVAHFERSVDRSGRVPESWRREVMRDGASVTEQQWSDYARDGFLRLGQVLGPEDLEALKRRADELALGQRKSPAVRLQLDTGGVYEELPEAVSSFDRGTLLYRKIQGLEADDLYSGLVRHPLFLEICAHEYGAHAPVSIFRAMVMNKPAGQGTVLPWHQDGGEVWALDRDPLVTVWVALDPATRANGCLEVIPGSHRLGLLSTHGSTVAAADVERHCPPDRVQPLEVEAGHAVLMHNWLIHRSGVNPSSVPRRAFTACFMDGRTQSTLTGDLFPHIAGPVPSAPYPWARELRESAREATAYARSLEAEVTKLRMMREEAERYARSLETEIERLRTPAPAAPRRGMLSRVRSRVAALRG